MCRKTCFLGSYFNLEDKVFCSLCTIHFRTSGTGMSGGCLLSLCIFNPQATSTHTGTIDDVAQVSGKEAYVFVAINE